VAALFRLSGSWHEVIPRLYNVCVLLIYAGVIYLAFRKQLGKQVASLTALALVTTGDILFWDSLLGLIDITFSLLMFMMFMAIFAAASKPRPGVYYLAAYLLASLGFMMKGLPSLVFLGLTWIALAISIRSWKPLLRLNHLYGIFLFLLILGAYALVYSRYNDPGMYLSIIWRESSQRTVMNHGWWNTFSHLFTFPFTIGYHFLPWDFMAGRIHAEFSPQVRLKKQSLLRFLLLTLGINIVLYWTSPEMHPRYLLMLLPSGMALIMGQCSALSR
jgi:4-amino-4-deoxy-L-arabinose transferase-like glycosyltransferase